MRNKASLLRRLTPLAPMAPAVALIVFAAAGAAAQNAGQNSLVDVQVGEAGRFLRVALICKTECPSRALAGGGFFVPGLDADIDVDLSTRTKNAARLSLASAEGGAALTLVSDRQMRRAAINPCEIDGARATCIDIEYSPPTTSTAAAQAPLLASAQATPASQKAAPEDRLTVPSKEQPTPLAPLAATQAPPQGSAPPAPSLREASDANLIFASLAPPERFAAPAAAKATPTAASREAGAMPSILATRTPQKTLDIREMSHAILGKTLGISECGGARARLRNDAWALDAMVDVGFCDAIAGKYDEADGVFMRLLAYTPDNYEALVGRALIAAKKGEKDDARAFFQEALNALPPIAESDRIVSAMRGL